MIHKNWNYKCKAFLLVAEFRNEFQAMVYDEYNTSITNTKQQIYITALAEFILLVPHNKYPEKVKDIYSEKSHK